MEASMSSITRIVALTLGLVLMLLITSSWGQPVCVAPGCNPTLSDANSNTAGGTGSLSHLVTGSSNTAFGKSALNSNTTGAANTASGFNALSANTTGNNNTASGIGALQNNTTGAINTASGAFALFSNSTGTSNTASGGGALNNNTTGTSNTANGAGALAVNSTGNNNTASGVNALLFNATGNLNAAIGFQALENNDVGNNNTAIGAKALKKSLGTKNIAIGFQAGVSLVNGNNNIYIGNQGAGVESQTIRIGTAQTQTFIAGIGNAIVAGPAVEVDTTTGKLGISGVSSARYKREIEPMGLRSAGVLQLRPVTFAYQQDAPGVVRYGLVAEEVQGVYPELVTHTATGELLAVRYQELIPMLVNELQREHQQVTTLRQELAELRSLVRQLQDQRLAGKKMAPALAEGKNDESMQ
jgi:hypothetical protein